MPAFTMAEAVEAVAFDALGSLVAVADLAGEVVVLAAGDLGLERRLPPHPGGATTLAWHPTRALLASGGVDGVLRLHGDDGVRSSLTLAGPVRTACWSPHGDLLAIGAGRSVWIIADDGSFVAAAPLLPGAVHHVAWVRGGPAPLAIGGHGGIAWFGPGLGAEPVASWQVTGAAHVLAADPQLSRLASGDLAGVLRVADPVTGDEVVISGWVDRFHRLAWSPSGRRLAVPAGEEVVVWHLEGTTVVGDEQRVSGHGGGVMDLVYSGSTLVTAGVDGRVRTWPPGERRTTPPVAVGAPVTRLAATGGRIVAGTHDGEVILIR